MNTGSINAIAAAILSGLVGIYPYFSRRNELTRLFALSNLSLSAWNLADLLVLIPVSHAAKVSLYRLSYIFGVFVIWYFFNFALAFARIDRNRFRKTLIGLKGAGVLLSALSLTPWIVSDIRETGYPFEVPGPLYPLFIMILVGGLGFAMFRLAEAYRASEGHQRTQLKYMAVALLFAFVEAPLFFFAVYTTKIASFFYYIQVIYSLIIAYAILAHRLMDINVIIRKTVVYSVVTGTLTGIYLLIATQLSKILEGAGGQAGFWSSAVAAAVITVLFNPLLNRVRSFMDEKFFGDWLRDMGRGVVHEVKRPLASISMPAQLTLMELEDIENGSRSFESFLPELKERLQGIVQKTLEAGDRIEALYALSESTGGEGKAVEIGRVIEASLTALKTPLDPFPISLTLDVAASLPPVRGDAKQLEIVFVNLIKNAAEAMAENAPEARRLSLKAGEDGRFVVVSVKDSGPGVSADDRAQLFDVHFTTKGSKGMGLGLYLTDKIVREHGGAIEVKSEEGKGTEFIVRLPKFSEKGSGVHEAA